MTNPPNSQDAAPQQQAGKQMATLIRALLKSTVVNVRIGDEPNSLVFEEASPTRAEEKISDDLLQGDFWAWFARERKILEQNPDDDSPEDVVLLYVPVLTGLLQGGMLDEEVRATLIDLRNSMDKLAVPSQLPYRLLYGTLITKIDALLKEMDLARFVVAAEAAGVQKYEIRGESDYAKHFLGNIIKAAVEVGALWAAATVMFNAEWQRGIKTAVSAKAGHEAVHGTAQQKAERWSLYRSNYDDIRKRNPNMSKNAVIANTAKKCGVSPTTIKRHCKDKK